MDKRKEYALVCWINAMVYDADFTSITEVKDNSTILLEILKRIDPEITVSVGDIAKNVNCVCQYVKNLFNPDVVDENEILRGNEMEIGKLLCLLLELALTGPNNMESIQKIQSLTAEVQTSVMVLTTMVSENSGKINLSDIMRKTLSKSASEESPPKQMYSPAASGSQSPTKSSIQTFCDSPEGRSFNVSSENTSPLTAFASSPQALYRRVMVENTKLRQKVRHSELFLKKRSQFDEQLALDVETESKEAIEENKKLLKEQEHFKEKIHDFEETVTKFKDEIEFLQLEIRAKDTEIEEQMNAKKKATDKVSQLQDNVNNETEEKLQLKQTQYEEEVEKNRSLALQMNHAEQQMTDLKVELVQIKEELDNTNIEMSKRKADYADQVAHLEEELRRLEKLKPLRAEAAQESLAATLQQDKEISSLKEQNAKLKLVVSANDSTIINMAKDMEMSGKQWKKERAELQEDLIRIKRELELERSRFSETSESNQIQCKQYMDQISSLLKQVEEHTVNNKGLHDKINNTDSKCKNLELQIEKFEDSERKVMEQIEHQKKKLNEERDRVKSLQEDLSEQKEIYDKLKRHNSQIESSMEVLHEELSRLKPFEQQCKDLLKECNHLKEQGDESNSQLNIKIQRLESQLKEKENSYLKLQNDYKKIDSYQQSLQDQLTNINILFNENKQRTSMLERENSALKVETESFSKQKHDFESTITQLQGVNNQLSASAEQHNVILVEYESCRNTVERQNKQLEEIMLQLQKEKHKITEKETALTEAYQKSHGDIENKSNEVKFLQGQVNEQTKTIKEFQNQAEQHRTLQQSYHSLQQQSLQLKQQISEQCKQVEEHSKQLLQQHKQIIQQEKQVEQQNKQLEQQNKQLEQQNEHLKEERTKVKDLLKDLSTQTNLNKKLNENISELKFSVKELADKNTVSLSLESKQANEIQKLKDLLDEKQTNIKEYEKEIKSLKESNTSNGDGDSEETQKIIDLCNKQDAEIKDYLSEREELLDELSTKNEAMVQLEEKCMEERTTSKRLNSSNRSLEAQLQCSEALVRDLRKELTILQENDEASSRPTSRNSRKQQKTTLNSDSDGSALHISELQTTSNKAEEIFQRSRRSTVHSRDVLILPTTKEEDSTDNEELSVTRTYSLRNKSERRRSFQPRRYMGGRTPPRRRTLMGHPMQAQMSSFSTEGEEEPDLMDNMEWNRISTLQEMSETGEEEQNRLEELQRRNTLCLPHLKSSYPIEVEVSKKDAPDDLISGPGKRKQLEIDDAPRGTFKRWKTDNVLRSTSDLSQMKRTTQSDSNLRNTRIQPRVEIDRIEISEKTVEKPVVQSFAFEITMEPAKKVRMPRSKASGNLTGGTVAPVTRRTRRSPQKAAESVSAPVPVVTKRSRQTAEKPKAQENTTTASFTRNENKRSSISRATRRIAANLRGRKAK